MQQKQPIPMQDEKITQTEETLAAIELNKQCMTAILSSMFIIEKELFAITDMLSERVAES